MCRAKRNPSIFPRRGGGGSLRSTHPTLRTHAPRGAAPPCPLVVSFGCAIFPWAKVRCGFLSNQRGNTAHSRCNRRSVHGKHADCTERGGCSYPFSACRLRTNQNKHFGHKPEKPDHAKGSGRQF